MDGGQLERGPARAHAEQQECNQMVALSAELDPGGGERESDARAWRAPFAGRGLDTGLDYGFEVPRGSRWTRGLLACLGPDPAPSPWGLVSGVGAQTGRNVG